MRRPHFVSLIAIMLIGASAAAGAQNAFTSEPQSIYAGPDESYPVVAQLGPATPVQVMGCLSDWSWCDVAFDDSRGWIYAPALNYVYQGTRVPLYSYAPSLGIPLVTFSLGTYWNRYYRGRPWYSQRNDWLRRRPPPHRRPPGPPPHAGPPPHFATPPRGSRPGSMGNDRPRGERPGSSRSGDYGARGDHDRPQGPQNHGNESRGGRPGEPGGNVQRPGGSTHGPSGPTQRPGGNAQGPSGNTHGPSGPTQRPGGNPQAPGGTAQRPGDHSPPRADRGARGQRPPPQDQPR